MSKLNWRQAEMKARKKFLRDMTQKPSAINKHAVYGNLFSNILDKLADENFLAILICMNNDITDREFFGKLIALSNITADSKTKNFYTNLLAWTIHGIATQLNMTPDKFLGEIAVEVAKVDEKIIEGLYAF